MPLIVTAYNCLLYSYCCLIKNYAQKETYSYETMLYFKALIKNHPPSENKTRFPVAILNYLFKKDTWHFALIF